MSESSQRTIVALTLALAEGRVDAEGSVSDTLHLATEMADHGLSTETIFQAVAIVGSFEEALALLDSGFPIEYILAMGETR